MSVLPHASNIFDIKFSGKTSQGHTTESRLPFNNGVLEFGSDYFDFVLPQQLVVTAPFEDVLLECKCTSQEWKSNLVLCSVRLDPVDTQPYAQRYRQNGQRAVLTNTKDSNLPHRQLESMRPRVGASYRLWKPWTVYSLYEEISLAMFAIVIAVAFAYMLLNGTK
ncbi:hypothetical protein IWW46_002255 [Coemansia sp. RSA 2440]|nr:hypothetical protein IWW46_002255 [Coemansia sp. RSA 2440]